MAEGLGSEGCLLKPQLLAGWLWASYPLHARASSPTRWWLCECSLSSKTKTQRLVSDIHGYKNIYPLHLPGDSVALQNYISKGVFCTKTPVWKSKKDKLKYKKFHFPNRLPLHTKQNSQRAFSSSSYYHFPLNPLCSKQNFSPLMRTRAGC